jgi:hypothetical protein
MCGIIIRSGPFSFQVLSGLKLIQAPGEFKYFGGEEEERREVDDISSSLVVDIIRYHLRLIAEHPENLSMKQSNERGKRETPRRLPAAGCPHTNQTARAQQTVERKPHATSRCYRPTTFLVYFLRWYGTTNSTVVFLRYFQFWFWLLFLVLLVFLMCDLV